MSCHSKLPAFRQSPGLSWSVQGLVLVTLILPPAGSSGVAADDSQPAIRKLTFEDVYGPKPLKVNDSDPVIRGWHDDEHYLETREGKLFRIRAADGEATLHRDPAILEMVLAEHPDFSADETRTLARSGFQSQSEDGLVGILTHRQSLYAVRLESRAVVKLTEKEQRRELLKASPDGQFVAWVSDHDLWIAGTDGQQPERPLTTGGSDLVRHGKADWVYFEEVFHRDWNAWKWSPDSKFIACLTFDDTGVGEYLVINQLPVGQAIERTRYPKAGTPNPVAGIVLIDVQTGSLRELDLSAFPADNRLITGWGFNTSGSQAWWTVQDRIQRWLEFHVVDCASGSQRRVFREDSETWIHYRQGPRFLTDDKCLWISDRTGFPHLYEVSLTDGECRALTDGDWEVRSLEAVDADQENIWFTGTRDSAVAEQLYCVTRTTGEIRRVTESEGHHSVRVSPQGSWVLDSSSDINSAGQLCLVQTSKPGSVRVLGRRESKLPSDLKLGTVELLEIPNRHGVPLQGLLVYPPDFDPNRKYPVWFMTYGGPHAPTVRNTWQRGRLSDHLLAARGAIVFRCDPHPASGRGTSSTRTAYQKLGELETQDVEDAIQWLTRKPYIDADRIGMSGHSYGGYLTAYVMTHTKLFCAGIAGAPVTDWQNYDTIYTERYMNTPQANADGYQQSSVVRAAAQLHGRLLLIHGLMDDNVHVSNTMQLVAALQKADKDFELMIYPTSRHGIGGSHYRRLMFEFQLRTLGLE